MYDPYKQFWNFVTKIVHLKKKYSFKDEKKKSFGFPPLFLKTTSMRNIQYKPLVIFVMKFSIYYGLIIFILVYLRLFSEIIWSFQIPK